MVGHQAPRVLSPLDLVDEVSIRERVRGRAARYKEGRKAPWVCVFHSLNTEGRIGAPVSVS